MKSEVQQYWLRLQGLPVERPPGRRISDNGGIEAKEEGIEKVLSHNEPWMDYAIPAAEAYVLYNAPTEFTGEDIRVYVEERAGTPSHGNAWGGLISGLNRARLIERTGEWRKAKLKSNHARMVPVYRKKA